MLTTLNQIRACGPCESGWRKLMGHLGKTKADDEPLKITTILDSNGLNDALWCLQAVKGHDRETRLFAVWCARKVQHLMTDQRSLDALDVAERFANGEATEKERAAAWSNVRYAVWSVACDPVPDAARAAVEDAAWSAAWDAARAAAWSDARVDARVDAMAAQANRLREICAEIEANHV